MSDIPVGRRKESRLQAQIEAYKVRDVMTVELFRNFGVNEKKLDAFIEKQTAHIKDGQNIDSFADVENALADKQDTLTGGNLVLIDNNTINAKIFIGTRDEWNALSVADKAKYTLVNITDDSETGETVDAVTDGDMRAVTSNAVFDKFTNKLHDARFLTFSTENTTVSVSIPTAYRGMCFISAYANDHDGIIDVRCDNSDNVAVTKLVGASAITVDTSQKNQISFTSTGYAVYALMQMSVSTDQAIVS